MDEAELQAAHEAASAAAAAKFEREKFGVDVASLRLALDADVGRELAARQTANTAASAHACERAEMACEEVLDR